MATNLKSIGGSPAKKQRQNSSVPDVEVPLPPLPEEDPHIAPLTLLNSLRPQIAAIYSALGSWKYNRTHFRTGGKYHSVFKFWVTEETSPQNVHDMIYAVLGRTCFRLNLSFGFIVGYETGEARYVYGSQNTEFFDAPKHIPSVDTLENTLGDLDSREILLWAKDQLPSSTQNVLKITNLLFIANKNTWSPNSLGRSHYY